MVPAVAAAWWVRRIAAAAAEAGIAIVAGLFAAYFADQAGLGLGVA